MEFELGAPATIHLGNRKWADATLDAPNSSTSPTYSTTAMSTPPLTSSTSASSSASSTSSSSPTIDFSQLTSEESLDILLQTISQNAGMPPSDTASELSPSTPPDWDQLAAWARSDSNNKLPDFSDFNFSLPMDLDFDASMAIDPNTLHFGSMFDQGLAAMAPENAFAAQTAPQPQELLYPTGDISWLNQQHHVQPDTGRRLSVTSSSSSSGASLSPIMETASVASSSSAGSSPPSESYLSDPASELAHKVRQMAGVTLAVPVSAQVQQMAAAGENYRTRLFLSPLGSPCLDLRRVRFPSVLQLFSRRLRQVASAGGGSSLHGAPPPLAAAVSLLS